MGRQTRFKSFPVMKNQRILILGGSGYVGSFLSPYLYDKGYEVEVVDIGWFGHALPASIPVREDDIFNLTQHDLKHIDTVIFLAGLSNDPMAEYSPQKNFIYNTAMPAYIGHMAKLAGVKRILFASSCSVYGFTHNQTFSETDLASCDYPYGVSKLQGERSLLALADENFQVLCIRQGTLSGYSPRMRLDLALNTMFMRAMKDQEIQLSNERIWRPILGTSDLCRAYELALEHANWNDLSVVNLASFNATIGELAEQVALFIQRETGKSISIHDKGIQDYRNYKVSTDKIKNGMGFQAQQNVESILRDLMSNLAEFTPFEQDRFYNIEVFKNKLNQDAHEDHVNRR